MRTKAAIEIKLKAIFIIFRGLLFKQIKQFFLEGEGPTCKVYPSTSIGFTGTKEEKKVRNKGSNWNTKHNSKAAGHSDIDSNVIIKDYDEISYPLFMIFHSSFNEGIFPEQLKVAKVSPIFKVGNTEEIGNYRPISVLPMFSKVLERIMYYRTYQYFKENDMFFPKQFGFHSSK